MSRSLRAIGSYRRLAETDEYVCSSVDDCTPYNDYFVCVLPDGSLTSDVAAPAKTEDAAAQDSASSSDASADPAPADTTPAKTEDTAATEASSDPAPAASADSS